jgi:hypothetical protein
LDKVTVQVELNKPAPRTIADDQQTLGFVGRLTPSLPLSRPEGLPVYVGRAPAAPFCETPHESSQRLAQPPYKFNSDDRPPAPAWIRKLSVKAPIAV